MTVQCPRCRTQYKIPTARINDPRPVFKCTRCSLVFSGEPERGARGKAREDKNLPLPFASRKESPSRAKPPAAVVDEDAPTIRSARDAEIEEDETLVEDETEDLESEDDEDAAEAEDDEEEDSEDDEEEEEPDEEPAKPARRPRRTRAADEDDATEPAFARAERERAAAERERERAAAERERERERIAAEKARVAAEKERARLAAEKERERQRAAAEREKERARAAAEKERARAAEARRRERELELEDDEDVDDDGPDDLGEDDDEPKRPVLRASESKQRRAPINPRRIRSANGATPSKSPLRTIAMGVAGVVAAYGIAALWLSRSSEAAIQTLSQVPVLGQLLGGDHLLVWRLQLTDVDGALDQIKGGRPAYVVSGRAVNTSNEDLRVIEIEGRLLVDGVEQRRQTVYAANQQRKTIQDLSPPEVEMLLRLEPNRRFVIRPGESASFLLVFPNPPPGTTEVTCRVLDARGS